MSFHTKFHENRLKNSRDIPIDVGTFFENNVVVILSERVWDNLIVEKQ